MDAPAPRASPPPLLLTSPFALLLCFSSRQGWTLGNVIEAFLGVPDASQVCRVVNGLYSVPDEASIAELWRACQSADHWLYVVTLKKEETER